MVGFCGAYTTFSSFSLLSFDSLRYSQVMDLWLNIGFSHLLCLLGVWLGLSYRDAIPQDHSRNWPTASKLIDRWLSWQ
jgi:fluoride exporter